MSSIDFFLLLDANRNLYYVILVAIGLLAVFYIKKKQIHILDPLFMMVIGCVFAYAVPFFLYYTHNCSFTNFIYFLISESVFWITFVATSKPSRFKPYEIVNESNYSALFFKICAFVYTLTSVLTYVYIGVGIYMESRLELYSTSEIPGSGVLGRFAEFSCFYILFYSFHKILKFKRKKYYFWLLFVIINSIFSGSRSSVFVVLTAFFVYTAFYQGRLPKIKWKYLLAIGSVPILVVLIASAAEDFSTSILVLLSRFVSNGDCYWQAYPDNAIDSVKIVHPFNTFFKGILLPFRLANSNLTDPSIGSQLWWMANPQFDGVEGGPNARLALFGWSYFGWAGILFSTFVGWLMSFMLYKSRRYFPNSFLCVFVYGYLYMISISMLTDFSLFLGSLATMLMNLLFYGCLLVLFSGLKLKYKRL